MFNLRKIAEKYKLIMVDIDNTLFNYTFAHKNALEATMKQYNFTLEDYDLAKKMIAKRRLSANHHKKSYILKLFVKIKIFIFQKPVKCLSCMFPFLQEI